jgi:hypothetical protein
MPIAGPPGPPPTTPFIVSEISKNWHAGKPMAKTPLIAQQFEILIEFNRQRGYRLHSFQLHRLMTDPKTMNESLIAVFERVVIRDTPKETT